MAKITETNCPHCQDKLTDEEILANECWTCGNPLPASNINEYDTEIDDETQD